MIVFNPFTGNLELVPVVSGGGGGGISSLNGLTLSTQTFSIGTTGTDFNILSSGSNHAFNIPDSSAINRGLLNSSDWTIFNNKIGGSGVATRVSFFSGSNTLNSSANFIWDNINNRLSLGTVAPLTNRDLQILVNVAGQSGILIQNTNTGGSTSIAFGESVVNFGFLSKFGSATSGNYAGTSIPFANTTNIQIGGNANLIGVINGGIIYNIIGALAGTVGTRLDATGLKIDTNTNLNILPATARLMIGAGTATASTAPLKFTSGTNLTTPEAGAVEYDGSNLFFTEGSTLRKAINGAVYTQSAFKTVGNTTTETSVLNSTINLPANFFKLGKLIRIQLFGFHSGVAGNTIRIKVKLNSTIVLDTAAVASGTSVNTTSVINGAITGYTFGVGGSVSAQGFYQETGGGANTFPMVNTATIPIDTTIVQTLDVTVQWNNADPGNTITITDGYINIFR